MKNNNKGFSLVELIVVIAIMAILAAVAIVSFSLYIPKAQQAGDRQTINDVIDAFTLHYYSDSEGVTGGYVVLGPDGAVDYDEFGAAAMEAAFGANWETSVKLQYADWQGVTSTATYKDTSYIGNEDELLGTVDTLTTALGNFVQGGSDATSVILNGGFGDYLTDNNIDMENGKAIGNAAVLYVAQETKANKTQIINGVNTGLENLSSANLENEEDVGLAVVMNLYNSIKAEGVSSAASLAAVYAYAEGYAQSTGQANQFHENTSFENVENIDSVLAQMAECFNGLDGTKFSEYVSNQGAKDLQGYVDMMDTVDANKGIVYDNLHSNDCFTDGKIANLLNGYAAMSDLSVTTEDGQVAIILTIDKDGNVKTHVAPLNWDK